MTRKTLGELMTESGQPEKAKETESQIAAFLFAPADQDSGLGVPFVPKSPRGFLQLVRYGKGHVESNKIHPTGFNFSPGLETGVLSQEGAQVFTDPSRFTDTGVDDPVLHFNRTSNGFFRKKADGESITVGNFKKNTLKNIEGEVSGHDLLAKEGSTLKGSKASSRISYKDDPQYAPVDPVNRPIAFALHQTLNEHNRFTPSQESPYLNYNEKGEAAFVKGLYTFQQQIGVFDKDAPSISIEDLRKIGGELLFKAQSISTGDAQTLMENRSNGGFGFTLDLMALIPHMTQIGGGKVNTKRLRVRVDNFDDAFSDIGLSAQDDLLAVQGFETILGAGGDDPNVGGNLSEALNASSFGTMNSPGENFSGVLSAGMAMPVLFGMIGVGLFGQFLLPTLVGAFKKDSEQTSNTPEAPWTYTLGRNMSEERNFGNDMLELMGFPRGMTTGIFGAISAGLMLFYGLKDPIGPFTLFDASFLEEAVNLFFSPGYYLVITKGVLRDISTITNAVTGLFSDFNGIFATIASVFSMIETIFTSYTFKFLVVMAQTGAQALRGSLAPGLHAHGGQAISYKEQRKTQLGPGNRLKLSRVHDPENPRQVAESPLSLSRHFALFLASDASLFLPGTVTTDSEALVGDHPRTYVTKTYQKISAKELNAIEHKIDAEYVPFSIQDMRTNEIISLPAFISSVTDDFAVQHASSHGYGRTDPVYTYSKTTRSITLVFNLVAMNQRDHHYLYHVINKLVTMCYPQRDHGLIRKKGTGPSAQFFAQPFSQSPTASPVIRVRLGDLIKSNKSAVAMKNIFGGENILTLKGDTKSEDVLQKARENAEFRFTAQTKMAKRRAELEKQFLNGTISKGVPVVIPAQTTITVKDFSGESFTFISQVDYHTTTAGIETEQGSNDSSELSKVKGSKFKKVKIDLKEVLEEKGGALAYGGKTLAAVQKSFEAALIPFSSLETGTVNTDPGSFRFLDVDILNDVDPNEGEGKTLNEIASFLDPANNPVVRSFMSDSPGKGLAGVITQLGISYDGAMWGTYENNAPTAPMKAQITMGFAPIHDLPLGLTADGLVMAPSHPAGPFAEAHMGPANFVIAGSAEAQLGQQKADEKKNIKDGLKRHVKVHGVGPSETDLENWSQGIALV